MPDGGLAAMADDPRIDCPHCKVPGQHPGMACGFCNQHIDEAPLIHADGTAAVEEVIGWRGWDLRRDEDGVVHLESPVFPGITIWTPGQWIHAECRSHGLVDPADPNYHGSLAADRANVSPVRDCGGGGHGCGFYAGRTREHLMNLGYNRYDAVRPRIIGQVQMEGKVIFATNGFRAEKVRPVHLYLPYELWQWHGSLAEQWEPHGCVVELATTIVLDKGSLDWCKNCGAKMNRTTICPLCNHTHNG